MVIFLKKVNYSMDFPWDQVFQTRRGAPHRLETYTGSSHGRGLRRAARAALHSTLAETFVHFTHDLDSDLERSTR